jgi:hypothetical protein
MLHQSGRRYLSQFCECTARAILADFEQSKISKLVFFGAHAKSAFGGRTMVSRASERRGEL